MNLTKSREYFDPDSIKTPINVVGVGAIGSNVAEQLARLGVKELNIYDFDEVDEHNIANQMFLETQIGMTKLDAIEQTLKSINSEIIVNKYEEGLQEPYIVNGYVFICVDSIDIRREIVNANKYNYNLKAIYDIRMRMTDAQCYAAWEGWQYEELLKTMCFTHEEAMADTPTTACGTTLSVEYAPKGIVCCAIANFTKLVLDKNPVNLILLDLGGLTLDTFTWRQKKQKSNIMCKIKKIVG